MLPMVSHKINTRQIALFINAFIPFNYNFFVMDIISIRNVQLFAIYYVIKNKNYFPWVFP